MFEYKVNAGYDTFNHFHNGRLTATVTPSDNLLWVYSDHLGTPRLKATPTGGALSSDWYEPFGRAINTPADGMKYRFTAKERDTESGLDYFGARYYSGAQGRFTSADTPLLSRIDTPQMWNLYAYTANNPLKRVDPDGRNWFEINGNWAWYQGSDVDENGKPCKPGARGCRHSDYTHMIVFKKTGINEYGAATGTLTLYGRGYHDIIAESAAFSGGYPGKGQIPEGTFTIRLDIRDTADKSDISQTPLGAILNPFYGIQQIPQSIDGYGFQWEWGSIRARLNEARGETREDFRGNFLHGKARPGDYTHGCIAERSEKILKLLLQMDPKATRAVPVDVRRK